METPPRFELGTPSLPWRCSATELRRHVFSCLPQSAFCGPQLPETVHWNPGFARSLVPGEGFEPPKALPADLQSAPFGRSGIPAGCCLQQCGSVGEDSEVAATAFSRLAAVRFLRDAVGHLLETINSIFDGWMRRKHLAHPPPPSLRPERFQRIRDEEL